MTADTSSIFCLNKSYETVIFIVTLTNNKTM